MYAWLLGAALVRLLKKSLPSLWLPMDIGCKIEIVPKASGLTDATHRCTPFPNHIFGELLSYRYLFQGCHEGLLSFSKREAAAAMPLSFFDMSL